MIRICVIIHRSVLPPAVCQCIQLELRVGNAAESIRSDTSAVRVLAWEQGRDRFTYENLGRDQAVDICHSLVVSLRAGLDRRVIMLPFQSAMGQKVQLDVFKPKFLESVKEIG